MRIEITGPGLWLDGRRMVVGQKVDISKEALDDAKAKGLDDRFKAIRGRKPNDEAA